MVCDASAADKRMAADTEPQLNQSWSNITVILQERHLLQVVQCPQSVVACQRLLRCLVSLCFLPELVRKAASQWADAHTRMRMPAHEAGM